MADIPEGIRVLFDEVTVETSDASSEVTDTTDKPKDWHQGAYPSYVPPHKRPHNAQEDKFVNFKDNPAGQKDKTEGVDNDKYQRLMLPVPFALPRDKLAKLKNDFPGIYFHCKDNGNHDHPFSHVVTLAGTRLMQRRIKAGSRVLDVYGNPNSCDGFNKSQTHAVDPKSMKALVNRCGPSDFIREVNKWGPFLDQEDGTERYHRGSLQSLINSGEIEEYNVLQFVHTLYYVDFAELTRALHAPCSKGKRVGYALIHRHSLDKGAINDGEQEYVKKYVGGRWLVKQTSVATSSAYVHPDLSSVLFDQKKYWLPKEGFRAGRDGTLTEEKPSEPKLGIAWDVHRINDETWVVEMVPYTDHVLQGVTDFAQEWEDDDLLSVDDYMTTPSSTDTSASIAQTPSSVVVPTTDGKFVELDIPCRELFDHLRLQCIGRKRDDKLLEQLISTANHLVNPSALFGDKPGMRCPPDKVYDVAVAAFVVDVQKEANITDCIAGLKPVLIKHARSKKLGPKFKDFSLGDLMEMLRMSLSAAQAVNRTVRAKDPVDAGLEHLQGWLN